jgi:hypothetical protein
MFSLGGLRPNYERANYHKRLKRSKFRDERFDGPVSTASEKVWISTGRAKALAKFEAMAGEC